jgi:hypothetical protein
LSNKFRLSSRHDGIIGEVRTIREHYWKPHIKKFFDRKVRAVIFSFFLERSSTIER